MTLQRKLRAALGNVPSLPEPGTGRDCTDCGWFLPASEFGPQPGAFRDLRPVCHECRRPKSRKYMRVLALNPEERAKRVLLQRAQANRMAWGLFRELRAEGRCAEFLARHPLGGGRRGRGYVYVLHGADDVVLYVGKAVDVANRIYIGQQAHRWTKEWFDEVESVTVYTYKTKDYSEAERWKIQELEPKYNKVRPKPHREEEPEPIRIEKNDIAHYLQ